MVAITQDSVLTYCVAWGETPVRTTVRAFLSEQPNVRHQTAGYILIHTTTPEGKEIEIPAFMRYHFDNRAYLESAVRSILIEEDSRIFVSPEAGPRGWMKAPRQHDCETIADAFRSGRDLRWPHFHATIRDLMLAGV